MHFSSYTDPSNNADYSHSNICLLGEFDNVII